MFRRWIVGTVTSLLGLFALVKGASTGAWLYALSGAALLAASVWHLASTTTLPSEPWTWGAARWSNYTCCGKRKLPTT
jgi:hypothetical protein